MRAVRRWLPTITVTLLVATGCALAGVWQWNRHVERSAAVAVVEANYAAEPVPIGTVLDQTGVPLPADDVWRPVTVTGRYLDSSVLLRNRPVAGRPGFHVLVPFLVERGELTGGVLVVDRGWVPTGQDSSGPRAVPSPPGGEVELVVRLRADERPAVRSAPAGQVHAIAVDQVRAASGLVEWPAEASVGAYGGLVSEDGSRPADLGQLPRPTTDLGSNLSYAFQWWVFGLGALVGCVVLIRREHREDRPSAPESARRPGRLTAEQEEDALLDAQR